MEKTSTDSGPESFIASWADVPARLRAGDSLPEPWESLFGPLRAMPKDRPLVVGQIGQSLDGRIATEAGRTCCINGPEGIAHLHRLRAVVDAVVVGAGTVRADDPRLTVREVAGPSPVRVVIDPRGSLQAQSRLFGDDGVRRIVITGSGAEAKAGGSVETISLPEVDGRLDPKAILDALFARGLGRILIEGGAQTVSSFLAAGCLDRLHVVVAPVILGSGLPGLDLPPIADISGALHPAMRTHALGSETLFDCDLFAARAAQLSRSSPEGR